MTEDIQQQTNVDPVRGGTPSVFIKTVVKLATNVAGFVSDPNSLRSSLYRFDGTQVPKGIMGAATVGSILYQGGAAAERGDYVTATEKGVQATLIITTAVPQVTYPIVKILAKNSVIRGAGKTVGKVLGKLTVSTAAGDIPLVPAVMDIGTGTIAAGERRIEGDSVGAKGEEVVAGVGAATYGATYGTVLVGGTAACVAFTGPFAPACEVGVVTAAPWVAYGASEGAKQVTANLYNANYNNPTANPNYTSDIRGSTEIMMAVAAYDEIQKVASDPRNHSTVRTSSHEPHSSDYRPRYENPSTNAPVIAKYDPIPEPVPSSTDPAMQQKLDEIVRNALVKEAIGNAGAGAKGLALQFCLLDDPSCLVTPAAKGVSDKHRTH